MAKLAPIATRQSAAVCIRLKKRCQPSESVRKRNVQGAEEADARIARLEDKIETLLSAMQSFIGAPGGASGASSVNILPPLQSLSGENVSPPTPFSSSTLVNSVSSANLGFNSSEGPTSTRASIAPVSPHPNQLFPSHPYSLPASAPSPYQTDERLTFFRSRMLPYFPFIDLTPDMTSGYLRQNRPCLFQAIHTVTTFSTQERLIQVEELKRLLFTSALLRVQSNIDLLLGLLTYLTWSTDAFLGRADLVSRLMMLAISLVYDMRLFKPSSPDVEVMMAMTQGRADESSRSPDDDTPYSLLEKLRAVLACFILSSNISSHLGRQDAIRWTPQMEDALRVIAMNESCPTDELFVAQVRLQLLKQKAEYVRQQDEAGLVRTGTATAAASAPRLLYLKALRTQLHELRSSFPPGLHQIGKYLTPKQIKPERFHISATRQVADTFTLGAKTLDLNLQTFSIPMPNTLNCDGGMLQGFERLECLWQSVENIKSWLDDFYRIPSPKLIGQPFHFWSQMILSITLLKYLSTLGDPEWDCQAVRTTVNLISTMDLLLQKLDLSSKEPELRCNDHLLKYLSKLLTNCRRWAEVRWNMAPASSQTQTVEARPDQNANPDTVTSHSHHSHNIPDLDQMVWMQSMDLGDDQWFEDVLGIPPAFS
ncbi:hypothetical protein ACJ72_04703 [Emergomyces africanus]|uniref:Transcription factor domain-containing protein n=1 Tax=Emergomyces africanus TaxID=1955775 RepID=A0A1B7NVZ4_9EURO|nr:hypothetical protein ACJ72_04703 [Emergomyces africanus]